MSSILKMISILLCVFMFACGNSSKNDDKTDTGETVTDSDSDAADTDSTDTEPTADTTPDNPDSDTDNPDTTPDSPDSDNPDTTPDNNDSENDDDTDTASEQNDDADTEPEQTDDDADTESGPTEAEKCADTGGIWNGFECLNPCDAASCSNFSYATDKCIPLNSTVYYCECEDDYYWHGEKGGCKTERPALGNICTDQDKCFSDSEEMTCPAEDEDFFGQDFQYADLGTCIPKAFRVETISGHNVVVDINTKLMWQQLTETLSWEDAVSHCENLEYAGYSDWRLPNPQELLTIVDNSKHGPAVNTTYFPNMPSDTSLWTSNKYTDSQPYSFSSYSGEISFNSTTTPCNVMCVRGEELFNESSFTTDTINGKLVVKDYTTGLMWQKEYQSSQTWQKALNYCETSTYAGYTDWRLPNKNELASLLNYDEPYSNFPDMPLSEAHFWSSSTYSSIMSAWRVSFHTGNVGYYFKTGEFYVRCVR